jgi:DNA-binding PadR family transcriptional regulator
VNQRDSARLFLLAELEHSGPASGRHLKRAARFEPTQLWSEVRVGSINRCLRRLEFDGLVEIRLSERHGRSSERIVYAVTEEGRQELKTLRHALLCQALTTTNDGPVKGTTSPTSWWARQRLNFSAWLRMPLYVRHHGDAARR